MGDIVVVIDGVDGGERAGSKSRRWENVPGGRTPQIHFKENGTPNI